MGHVILFLHLTYSWGYCVKIYNLIWWYFGVLSAAFIRCLPIVLLLLFVAHLIKSLLQAVLCTKEYVKVFLSNVFSFILNSDNTNFLFFFPDEKFVDITVHYKYNSNNKSFEAKLEYGNPPKNLCGTVDCKELKYLQECSKKNFSVSDGSCTPAKMIELDVPPGECQFLSICI